MVITCIHVGCRILLCSYTQRFLSSSHSPPYSIFLLLLTFQSFREVELEKDLGNGGNESIHSLTSIQNKPLRLSYYSSLRTLYGNFSSFFHPNLLMWLLLSKLKPSWRSFEQCPNCRNSADKTSRGGIMCIVSKRNLFVTIGNKKTLSAYAF